MARAGTWRAPLECRGGSLWSVPCGSCTRPTGISGARCTGPTCARRRPRFLDHLVETARAERVDAVLVAGDVYDRAIPPVDAVALCEDALVRLRDDRRPRDRDQRQPRLGAPPRVQQRAHRRVRRAPADPARDARRAGPAARRPRPGRRLRRAVPGAGARPARPAPGCDGAGRGATRPSLGEAARRASGPTPRRAACARTVVLAHAWVARADDAERRRAGGRPATPSGTSRSAASATSRRACSTGSATWRSATCTASRRWRSTCATAARRCRTRSPRRDHKKGSWLVEVGVDGKTRAERVPAPVYRRLTVLRGRLEDLLTVAPSTRPRGRLPRRDAHRHGPPRGGDGPAAAAGSRTS